MYEGASEREIERQGAERWPEIFQDITSTSKFGQKQTISKRIDLASKETTQMLERGTLNELNNGIRKQMASPPPQFLLLNSVADTRGAIY
jgi:hypothetical protein